VTALRSLEGLRDLVRLAGTYLAVRARRPEVPARQVLAYLRSDGSDTLDEFLCPGHEWSSGYDEGTDREVRCYCLNCGKDGDG